MVFEITVTYFVQIIYLVNIFTLASLAAAPLD